MSRQCAPSPLNKNIEKNLCMTERTVTSEVLNCYFLCNISQEVKETWRKPKSRLDVLGPNPLCFFSFLFWLQLKFFSWFCPYREQFARDIFPFFFFFFFFEFAMTLQTTNFRSIEVPFQVCHVLSWVSYDHCAKWRRPKKKGRLQKN